jgi:hypothetical protein
MPKGQSLNVDEILERYGNVLETVEKELHNAGVQTMPQAPHLSDDLNAHLKWDEGSGAPLTPDDLTIYPPLVLGQLYSYWTAWANYYETLAGAAKAKVEVVANKLDVVKSALECYYREEESIAIDLIKAKVLTDTRYVDWDVELSKAKQFARGAETALASFKRTSNNISREQSRRSDEFGFGARGGGGGSGSAPQWGNKGRRD